MSSNINTGYYFSSHASTIDYYPFGQEMPGRVNSPTSYRYGFNGKENDNEVAGTGNWQNYGMREYDARLCRFISVDPLTAKYPWYTPYQFAGNKPIFAFDLDGLEDVAYIYKMEGHGKTLIETIDYRNIDAGTGPLGSGTYVQIINKKGDKFVEAFVSRDGNSIPSFNEANIKRANFKDLTSRLNARLVEKTVENALVEKGFDRKDVEKDVKVLDTDEPGFNGKFATFQDGTAAKYTKDWQTRDVSSPHKSTGGKGSGTVGNTSLELKYYDGASSQSDNLPNQIGFTQYAGTLMGKISHIFEAIDAVTGTNTSVNNAKTYKNASEKK